MCACSQNIVTCDSTMHRHGFVARVKTNRIVVNQKGAIYSRSCELQRGVAGKIKSKFRLSRRMAVWPLCTLNQQRRDEHWSLWKGEPWCVLSCSLSHTHSSAQLPVVGLGDRGQQKVDYLFFVRMLLKIGMWKNSKAVQIQIAPLRWSFAAVIISSRGAIPSSHRSSTQKQFWIA